MAKRQQQKSRKERARKERIRKEKARDARLRKLQPDARVNSPGTRPAIHSAEVMHKAVAFHNAGRVAEAEALYRQVLKNEPEHPDALSSLAMIHYQAKRFNKAVEGLRKAIGIVGDNPGYFMNLGAAETGAQHWAEAELAYRRAIELAPGYADPYYNLGDLYLLLDRPREALDVFDACMDHIGREFHALAYKAHALEDAGRHDEARYLLDYDQYVKAYSFDPPQGYDSLKTFNEALTRHVSTHPTLRADVMSTEHGKHTGELLREPTGPMGAMQQRIQQAVRWYIDQLPHDPQHPAVKWAPRTWKLTTWGVVMSDQGHERAHIHPNGWLSGVFYLDLPDLIEDPARQPEGWLEFGRPTTDLHVKSDPVPRHYQPAYGTMFLFPSYFYHGTVPFHSRQRRVCIAFDVEPLS